MQRFSVSKIKKAAQKTELLKLVESNILKNNPIN